MIETFVYSRIKKIIRSITNESFENNVIVLFKKVSFKII